MRKFRREDVGDMVGVFFLLMMGLGRVCGTFSLFSFLCGKKGGGVRRGAGGLGEDDKGQGERVSTRLIKYTFTTFSGVSSSVWTTENSVAP